MRIPTPQQEGCDVKCKHEKTRGLMWASDYDCWMSGGDDARVCRDCGEWLPLGPSDETDPRVAVEVRAAELAQQTSGVFCSNDAWSGWQAASKDWEPAPTTEARAAWLAFHIVQHDHTVESARDRLERRRQNAIAAHEEGR